VNASAAALRRLQPTSTRALGRFETPQSGGTPVPAQSVGTRHLKGFHLPATSNNTFPEAVDCGLTAFASVRATQAQIPAMRRKPHEHIAPPAGLLKYVDEQVVVAQAAVYHAIHDFNLREQNFTHWGVVAGPRFLGRESCALSLDRFYRLGALAVSPLVAPYVSLHAVSGTISMALKIHGPNVGVCGGNGGVAQTFLAGLTMQREHCLPGVWMVISEWDPEPIPDDKGKGRSDGVCRAVAMAFTEAPANWQGLRLRLVPNPPAAEMETGQASLGGLAAFLTGCKNGGPEVKSWHFPLPWNARLELTGHCHNLAYTASAVGERAAVAAA